MGSSINFVSIALALCSFSIGIFLHKKKKLFFLLLSLGLLFVAFPFVNHQILTRGAYEWKIVVLRHTENTDDPRIIFIRDIEWITDYEKLKKKRGRVGSLLLDKDTTGKEWDVKGFIPLYIKANILIGSDNISITRTFKDMPAGSYTFTLTFNEKNRGSWSMKGTDVESHEQ